MKPEDKAGLNEWLKNNPAFKYSVQGCDTRTLRSIATSIWRDCCAHRDAQPAVAVNEQMLDVLKFIQRGMERNHIKAKPFLDFSNPNAESLELQHPLTLVNAAIAAAEKAKGGV